MKPNDNLPACGNCLHWREIGRSGYGECALTDNGHDARVAGCDSFAPRAAKKPKRHCAAGTGHNAADEGRQMRMEM
jgi:hypothetical protein